MHIFDYFKKYSPGQCSSRVDIIEFGIETVVGVYQVGSEYKNLRHDIIEPQWITFGWHFK